MSDDTETASSDSTTEPLVELGRSVDNCEKHGDVWCSCKVRQFLDMASLLVATKCSKVALEADIERLKMQVIYLRWTVEQAVGDIERGREFDAIHGLRRALESGSSLGEDTE